MKLRVNYLINLYQHNNVFILDIIVECYIKYPYGYNIGLRNYKYDEGHKWTKTEISDERFTELIVATGSGYAFEGEQRIFARIGNEVVYLRHNGEADAETMIEAIAEKFT